MNDNIKTNDELSEALSKADDVAAKSINESLANHHKPSVKEEPGQYVVEDTVDLRRSQATDESPSIKKNSRLHKAFVVVMVVAILAMVLFAVGYTVKTLPTTVIDKYEVDTRACEYNKDGVHVIGKRSYKYRYNEILGYRFIDTRTMEEVTEIYHDFTETVVVGIDDGDWWKVYFSKGEPARMMLPPTEFYTFVQGEAAAVIDYEGFCRLKKGN